MVYLINGFVFSFFQKQVPLGVYDWKWTVSNKAVEIGFLLAIKYWAVLLVRAKPVIQMNFRVINLVDWVWGNVKRYDCKRDCLNDFATINIIGFNEWWQNFLLWLRKFVHGCDLNVWFRDGTSPKSEKLSIMSGRLFEFVECFVPSTILSVGLSRIHPSSFGTLF